jgi:TRAP-type C4-dicarboxylate transport system substrate-binding protein
MISTKRRALVGAIAASPLLSLPAWGQAAATTIKISHQFPGGTLTEGDFRDRLTRMFDAEVEKRTKGSLKFEIYPGASLMKINAQISSVRRGALDMSLVPLSYAGGEMPEVNIGLMPGLVTSYDQGYSWKDKPVGKELSKFLAEKGIIVVSWIWQAGGMASRSQKPILGPEDAKGLKIRGGSREMDEMLKAAGAAVVTGPTNEIYAGMQTGAMDAALTSSTSLISFRLEEVAKSLTTGRGGSYWFMFEPLLMSKAIFDKLTKEQQQAIMSVGAEMEQFARKSAQTDDDLVAAVYKKKGATVGDLNADTLKKWQKIARETAWKDYAGRNAACANLLKLAEQTL